MKYSYQHKPKSKHAIKELHIIHVLNEYVNNDAAAKIYIGHGQITFQKTKLRTGSYKFVKHQSV